MRYCSDPTADQALGSVSRQWNRMAKLALEIRKDPYSEWAERESRRFTGIFKRLLTDPIDESGHMAS